MVAQLSASSFSFFRALPRLVRGPGGPWKIAAVSTRSGFGLVNIVESTGEIGGNGAMGSRRRRSPGRFRPAGALQSRVCRPIWNKRRNSGAPGRAAQGSAKFLPRRCRHCLTPRPAGSYIALTKGGPHGVAGFGDLSVKRRSRTLFGSGHFCRDLCWGFGSLTSLMEEREAQAAGSCGSGGIFVFGHWPFGRRNAGCVLREPRNFDLRVGDAR
jgi:hypothetical protein